MKRDGRIVIEIESPVLINDPTLYNTNMVATIRDWANGLPYIPAGVIIQALRNVADILCLNNETGAFPKRLFGTKEAEGILWVGHATYNGIPLTTQSSLIAPNLHVFPDDTWDALTKEVQVWYGGGLRTVRGIAPGCVMEAPLHWLETPDQAAMDFLSASCAGIRTIGEKTGQGLGRVKVSISGMDFSNKNLTFLRG